MEVTFAIGLEPTGLARLKKRYPAGRTEKGEFVITIRGEEPAEVALQARRLLEELKIATATAKDFK